MNRRGFTLPEVLIALVIITIAIGSLALVQVNNLRSSVTSRLATDTKTAANQTLELLMADVLRTDSEADPKSLSADDFAFYHFYWTCPTLQTPPSGPAVVQQTCRNSTTVGDVDVEWVIRGESGILGEGVVSITVTAEHKHRQQRLTIGDRVTCYDVYPTPAATAPEPCPRPTTVGGGRI
jgi:prepilin-type N-terminal cleavage/methylation domain-containing protein